MQHHIALHRRIPWIAGLGLMLSGCQQHGASDSWFPLVAGTQQTYETHFEGDEAQEPDNWTISVEGPEKLNDQTVMVRHHSAGIRYYLQESDAGVRRLATRTDIDRDPTEDETPIWVLKAPYQVGTEWTGWTVPYYILRINEHPRELKYSHKVLMTWRIEAVDDAVTTQAGESFKPCLRVVGKAKLNLYVDPVHGFTDVPLTSQEWYCKGVGLTKLIRTEKVPPGFMTGGEMTAELVDH